MVLLSAGKPLPASNRDMEGSNGAKQADSWHKHEPFMMVDKQKNKGKHDIFVNKYFMSKDPVHYPPSSFARLLW